jgi:hypothetical protein
MTARIRLLAVVTAGVALTALQVNTAGPRTPWGEPDLQGVWTSEPELGVPFERPAAFGDRLTLTDEEFAARIAQAEQQAENARGLRRLGPHRRDSRVGPVLGHGVRSMLFGAVAGRRHADW